jgi:predicted O-methyltransferase YrrM
MLRRVVRRAEFERFLTSLPPSFRDPARLLFYDDMTEEEMRVAELVESLRDTIVPMADCPELHSYSSPHSGTFRKDGEGHAVAGPYIAAPIESHAQTGVGKTAGILLRRIVVGIQARRILELGTNTGLSGCYFLSCPQVDQLVTIEGSQELSRIADRNLGRLSARYRLMNMLFDEALDVLAREEARFDCVFIDGQHERESTWHYTHRALPLLDERGVVIFDDIYWSDDMHQFWREACDSREFSETVDLRRVGLGVRGPRTNGKRHHDACRYVGRPAIGHEGW